MSDPYRESSKVPVYFEPRIEKISHDEYKTAKESVVEWRIAQFIGFCLIFILSGWAVYDLSERIYWPWAPLIVSCIFTIYTSRNAKFNRNIVLEYLRRNG